MRISKSIRIFCSILMSIIMTNLPSIATAEAGRMIPTAVVIEEVGREQNRERLESVLSRADLQNELSKLGVSPDEARRRLASLSDSELRDLAGQMEQARYGGDILVTVLLIVLIIYLVKRI